MSVDDNCYTYSLRFIAPKRDAFEEKGKRTKSLSSPPPPPPNLDRLVANPKTVAARQMNTKILREFNRDHMDDIFDTGVVTSAKPRSSRGRPKARNSSSKKADNIIDDLFNSDSENDISIHSSRTPIGNYLSRSRNQTPLPPAPEEENEDEPKIGYSTFRISKN